MEFDFSFISNGKEEEKPRNLSYKESYKGRPIDNTKEGQNDHTSEINAKKEEDIKRQVNTITEIQDRNEITKRILLKYERNTRKASLLKADVMKDIKQGLPLPEVILKLAKIVSNLTGEEVFYNTIEGDIMAIYGEALHHEEVLEIKLNDLQERLNKLHKAMEAEHDRSTLQRIRRAIEWHRKEEARIKNLITASK